MNNQCWACRQRKCNRCIGCPCTHEASKVSNAEATRQVVEVMKALGAVEYREYRIEDYRNE